MQLSQLYRRGVVRPLDDCAAHQLAALKIELPIRVEWLPILDDTQFAAIWESGVFQRINDACGIEIADYEEVELAASKIGPALQVVRKETKSGAAVSMFFEKLETLLSEAIATNKSVYFVL